MGITPVDVHNKEFRKKLFGGYDRDQVDEFLDQVIRELESMIRENERLKEKIEDLGLKLEQYRTLEETINKTLVVAQEAAEDIRTNARKEADVVIQEARLQAERIIEAGQVKARRIVDENADLTRAAHVLRTQVRAMLQAQLEAIDHVRDPFGQAQPASLAAVAQLPPEKP